jgi:hypothetical protein
MLVEEEVGVAEEPAAELALVVEVGALVEELAVGEPGRELASEVEPAGEPAAA